MDAFNNKKKQQSFILQKLHRKNQLENISDCENGNFEGFFPASLWSELKINLMRPKDREKKIKIKTDLKQIYKK